MAQNTFGSWLRYLALFNYSHLGPMPFLPSRGRTQLVQMFFMHGFVSHIILNMFLHHQTLVSIICEVKLFLSTTTVLIRWWLNHHIICSSWHIFFTLVSFGNFFSSVNFILYFYYSSVLSSWRSTTDNACPYQLSTPTCSMIPSTVQTSSSISTQYFSRQAAVASKRWCWNGSLTH